MLAGKGSGHQGGSGSGAGTHAGAREAQPGVAEPQTLAPGAMGGAGGRFGPGSGIVIVHGEQAFQNYVAAAVNGAVARGVTVTATSAQRGSPVGH